MTRPVISNHGSEIILLGILGSGVLCLLLLVAWRGPEGWDVAACLLVLQRIVDVVQKRWEQRGLDSSNAMLHASKPDPEAAALQSMQDGPEQ